MLSKLILSLLGWQIKDSLSKRSVVAVFPHTSYLDGVIGFLAMRAMRSNYKVMSAEWLFFWPFKYVMKYLLHAFPVGPGSSNAITKSVNLLKQEDCNLIICPEGQLAATDKWNPGFYIIAKKANVPIDVALLNYKDKTIHIVNYPKNYLDAIDCKKLFTTFSTIGSLAAPKHPHKFKFPKV